MAAASTMVVGVLSEMTDPNSRIGKRANQCDMNEYGFSKDVKNRSSFSRSLPKRLLVCCVEKKRR
jgi:hypothetical protein